MPLKRGGMERRRDRGLWIPNSREENSRSSPKDTASKSPTLKLPYRHQDRIHTSTKVGTAVEEAPKNKTTSRRSTVRPLKSSESQKSQQEPPNRAEAELMVKKKIVIQYKFSKYA